jgi:hypothetical protein
MSVSGTVLALSKLLTGKTIVKNGLTQSLLIRRLEDRITAVWVKQMMRDAVEGIAMEEQLDGVSVGFAKRFKTCVHRHQVPASGLQSIS